MVRRYSEAEAYDRENVQGGKGTLKFYDMLKKDEFFGKGRLYSTVTVKPGESIGFHVHEGEMEVYFILNGKGKYDDNGVEVEVGPMDTTITNPGEGHSIECIGDEDLVFIGLIIFE